MKLRVPRRLLRCAAPILLLISGTALGQSNATLGQAGAATAPAPDTASTINVSARLVIVPVTVRDRKGVLDKTLAREDFALAVDGKPQAIRYFDRSDDAPLTLGLLVDVSGSVRDVLDDERTASAGFLESLLKPERDRAFIVQFGHQADLLADVTSSLPKLQAALKRIDQDSGRPSFNGTSRDEQEPGGGDTQSTDAPQDGRGTRGNRGGYGRRGGGFGGGTVLYDAVFLASDEVLAKQKNRKALVLLTDGEDRGSKEAIGSAIEAAQRADVTVDAIYFKGESGHGGSGGFPGAGHRGGFPGGGQGHGGGSNRGEPQREDGRKVLERICGETGGRVFMVSRKETFPAIYREIAEELRSEYRLGFTPADTSDGYHRLDVTLPKDRKLTLQARDGYYSGPVK